MIFVANGDGIWILQQHLAEDPEVDKAYDDYVLYGSSMYPSPQVAAREANSRSSRTTKPTPRTVWTSFCSNWSSTFRRKRAT